MEPEHPPPQAPPARDADDDRDQLPGWDALVEPIAKVAPWRSPESRRATEAEHEPGA